LKMGVLRFSIRLSPNWSHTFTYGSVNIQQAIWNMKNYLTKWNINVTLHSTERGQAPLTCSCANGSLQLSYKLSNFLNDSRILNCEWGNCSTSLWTMPSSGMLHHVTVVFLHIMLWLLVTANVVPSLLIVFTRRWRQHVPLKHRLLQQPHGITSQKTAFLTVTAVETSNVTYFCGHLNGYQLCKQLPSKRNIKQLQAYNR
jgi:hypothetical protein